MQFYEREKANLLKLRHVKNIMQILDEKKVRVALHEIRIDLIFEYCPLDLLKIIKNRQILFQLAEVKTFMREILLGVRAMHTNKVSYFFYSFNEFSFFLNALAFCCLPTMI